MAEAQHPAPSREFYLTERRHFGGTVPRGAQSSLGPGLVPVGAEDGEQAALAGVPHVARQRIAHDTAELTEVPGHFLSTTTRDYNSADAASHWQTVSGG